MQSFPRHPRKRKRAEFTFVDVRLDDPPFARVFFLLDDTASQKERAVGAQIAAGRMRVAP